MKSRRRAREAALQALYQCDTNGDFSPASVALFFETFQPAQVAQVLDKDDEDEAFPADNEHRQFANELLSGVIDNIEEINGRISAASTHWSLSRMSRVDRNILRIATFELLYCPEIPLNVTINEAIEVAKRFGSDDSPMFINGVLDHVAKLLSEKTLGLKRKSA